MELSDRGRRVREGVVGVMKGGRQWWVLTHHCLVFVHGWLSSYMDCCCCMWVVDFLCGRSFLYVGSCLRMWAVDVDVVCGHGHVVGGCVTVVVMCIILWVVCIICRLYVLCAGGMHCLWAVSSLEGGQTVVCGWPYPIAMSPTVMWPLQWV